MDLLGWPLTATDDGEPTIRQEFVAKGAPKNNFTISPVQ